MPTTNRRYILGATAAALSATQFPATGAGADTESSSQGQQRSDEGHPLAFPGSNVSAPLSTGFVETFLDNGYVNMTPVIRALHECGYSGAVISDHNPHMAGGHPTAEALAVGYMRGLIRTISGV